MSPTDNPGQLTPRPAQRVPTELIGTYRLPMPLASKAGILGLTRLLGRDPASEARLLVAELAGGAQVVGHKPSTAAAAHQVMKQRVAGTQMAPLLDRLAALAATDPGHPTTRFDVFGTSYDGQVVVDLVADCVLVCWVMSTDREMTPAGDHSSPSRVLDQ